MKEGLGTDGIAVVTVLVTAALMMLAASTKRQLIWRPRRPAWRWRGRFRPRRRR